MMTAEDVAAELGISKGHAYKVIRQLNKELENSGYIVVAGKVPRAFWETRRKSRKEVLERRKKHWNGKATINYLLMPIWI